MSLLELLLKREVAAPELPHEQWIEHARRLNQLAQGFLIPGGEGRYVYLQWRRHKTCRHLIQLIEVGGRCGGSLLAGTEYQHQDSG